MASVVSICNRALALLGANSITSLDDDTTEAKVCAAVFDDARDAVLRSAPWACATHRATLAQLSTDPVWGWDKAYALPNDPYCLAVLDLKEADDFKVEGRTLVTNTDSATIKYVARITDPGVFDPALVFALSCRLAAEIAYALTQNRALTQDTWVLAERAIMDAATFDGAEAGRETINADLLMDARA